VACHTHELLSCPCGTSSLPSPPEEEEDIEGPPDKPRRKFIQDDSDEDDEEKGFVVATQFDPDKLSKSVSQLTLYETPLTLRRKHAGSVMRSPPWLNGPISTA
jgi:hypothetical protein